MKIINNTFQCFLLFQYCLDILIAAEPSSYLDTLKKDYSFAAKTYDLKLLRKIENIINNKSQREVEEQLLLGLIYWRYQIISYCNNDQDEVIKNGKRTIEELTKAESIGADPYITTTHKALAYLLMSGTSLLNGTKYNPKMLVELKKSKELYPHGYFTRLIEAIKYNQTPAIAGGNPMKAVTILEKMSYDFPDSVDVRIHLSEAYLRTGNIESSKRILKEVLEKHPSNLLAKKIEKILKEK
ncbi:MAG: tetratricopeptide repeat protein [Chitinispirillaceae bacterium]|nr:tetratricopeptide repeat protein [Chitinispirillaceae bacterium]